MDQESSKLVELTTVKGSALDVIGALADWGVEAQETELGPPHPEAPWSVPTSISIRACDLSRAQSILAAMDRPDSPVSCLDELHLHCHHLACILSDTEKHLPSKTIDDEAFEVSHAVEWLNVAAGIQRVDVISARFDDCAVLCDDAWRYEDARSDVFSRIVTELALFNFVWNAFETVAKVLDLPDIPSERNPHCSRSLVDRAIWMLTRGKPVVGYSEVLEEVSELVFSGCMSPRTVYRIRKWLPYMGYAGLGLDVVRCCRNELAHGATRFPEPEEWSGKPVAMPQLLRLSSRLVLFSIQMLLEIRFREDCFTVLSLDDTDDNERISVGTALLQLHLRRRAQDQPALFDE